MPRKPKRINRYHHPKSPELQARNQMIVGSRMMGATITALATGYGLSRSHVHRIVAGVPILISRPKRPPKSRARPGRFLHFLRLKNEARSLRRLGLSYSEIAERLGISRGCAFNAARMVRIAELRGRAWLSHEQGRPRAWKRELLSRTRPPVMPLASEPARGSPGYAVPS